eukprot:821899-Pleurochrysis_carterae.AAC.1
MTAASSAGFTSVPQPGPALPAPLEMVMPAAATCATLRTNGSSRKSGPPTDKLIRSTCETGGGNALRSIRTLTSELLLVSVPNRRKLAVIGWLECIRKTS